MSSLCCEKRSASIYYYLTTENMLNAMFYIVADTMYMTFGCFRFVTKINMAKRKK